MSNNKAAAPKDSKPNQQQPLNKLAEKDPKAAERLVEDDDEFEEFEAEGELLAGLRFFG